MKMNKVKIVKSVIDGNDALVVITLKPDGKKINMTVVYPDCDCCAEVLIADDGFVVSKEEVGYEDFEETYKAMWEK